VSDLPRLKRREPLTLPLKVLQFGEGNFLRTFFDWMIQGLNNQGLFNGSIRIVQPITQGKGNVLNAQDGCYTTILRGIEHGNVVEQSDMITCVSDCVNPYDQWDDVVSSLCCETLEFIVSNTTESGIHYQPEPWQRGRCPDSFPAKIASLLYERYRHFNGALGKGIIVLPCELIENNGEMLRQIVHYHAEDWKLETGFVQWLDRENLFVNTLVDRIVPGFPQEEYEAICVKLGYTDELMSCGELFHFFALESLPSLEEKLPLIQGGFNVVMTSNLKPYRDRKVRFLNGAHTATALAAHLCGLETVDEMVREPLFAAYLKRLLFDEIYPTVPLPDAEKSAFAESVLERFANPFVKHRLLSIALNSVSKWKVRVLPSLMDYHRLTGKLPLLMVFSLAALIMFYRNRHGVSSTGHAIEEAPEITQFFEAAWMKHEQLRHNLAETVLGRSELWDSNLNEIPGLTEEIARLLGLITSLGIRDTLSSLLANQTL
jgi:tagaturonate reductase